MDFPCYSVELSKPKNYVVDLCRRCIQSESQIRGIVDSAVKEELQCMDGSLEILTMPTANSPCSASFSSNASTCIRSFHQKFVEDKSDPALCS